jgi:hypothetical protein
MLTNIAALYIDGFRRLRLGRTLWLIIALKLLVLLTLIRPWLFPDFLQTRFDNDAERGMHVLNQLTKETQR